jgi:asparagine synthase (glutamine-hydrolysing)
MCGIAGQLNANPAEPCAPGPLERALERIHHRGPDDMGLRYDGPAAIGMRRLSIIDLAGSRQPIANEDGTIWVVFNGEIYNYQELRAELAPRHQLRTEGDTELLVHLYEELGDSMVERLRGMFAFALYDSRRRRLLIGRDRLGKKPLFYHWDGKRLVFASELKALLAWPDVPRQLDPRALDAFLALQYVPEHLCIFATSCPRTTCRRKPSRSRFSPSSGRPCACA